MTALAITSPLPQFFDLAGDPLSSGRIYFGTVGANPETSPVTVYWDSAATQPAAQPLRTLGGYIARDGTPASVYSNGTYSISVKDKRGRLVFYCADSSTLTNDALLQGDIDALRTDVTDNASTSRGAGLVPFNPTLNYVASTLGRSLADREWNPRDFPWLAKFDGATDDTAALLACLNALYAAGGGTMVMPRGTARVTSLAFNWAGERSIVIRGQGMTATTLQKITGSTTPVVKLTATTQPQVVHSVLQDFAIVGDGTRTHNGLQVESLAYLHTDNLRIQSCDIGLEILGSLIATHKRPYWVDCNIGVRLRKQGAVYANLLSFEGGEIGSNSTLGMDLGECSGIHIRDTELYGNGTIGNSSTGCIRIRSSVDDETGFSRITMDNVWLENNKGRSFVVEDAGALYLSVRGCNFTGGGADACYVGAIGTFLWENCEAASPGLSDMLTVAANRCVLIGGIVYQITDTSAFKTRIGFRTSASSFDFYTEKLTMGGNLYTTPSLAYKTFGGVAAYSSGSYTEGDHIAGFIDRDNVGNLHAFFTSKGFPGNAAGCGLRVGNNSSTSRSINAGGTVNASGADYAEYEHKRADCGLIAKGDVIGFDDAGLLTDRWSLARTFGVKSTSPSLVGGDDWGAGLLPDESTGQLSPENAEELERRRQLVDRIAYSGKVPCNITAGVGDYVVPTEGPGDTITAVGVAEPDASEYRRSIGQVRSIGADGRPIVAVKVS